MSMQEITSENMVNVTRRKRSKLALISLVLGVLYLVSLIYFFTSKLGSGVNDAENVGMVLAVAIVFPHAIVVFIAVLFNALGFFMNRRAFVLVGAILYAVAMVIFMPYFMFVLIQMVLSFIAYARMPKI